MVWQLPLSGFASLTHYDLPINFLASCGCSYGATFHPTAALSSLAYSGTERQSLGPGPGCGQCFNLTLLEASQASPPFIIPEPDSTPFHTPKPSVVVKVIDKCPSPVYCTATRFKPNKFGHFIHFDLALPSPALNQSFFPANRQLYGYDDFGIWDISYQSVSCELWSGWSNKSTLEVEKSYPGYQDNCCPSNPGYTNQLCPQSAINPNPIKINQATLIYSSNQPTWLTQLIIFILIFS
ncbi:hypothetical protein O181_055903 [Austropuccinia psidii MF-1]|uniref:Expansin-like EG45 domain-containing protein n=1 Tax=Austropuccinia psidii MF-1 TaxID=1389203 RepID=A0A9Q3HSY0_9BASI|nr:hypothetical protein [Austropuccinia psidii MF-1]